MILNHTFQIKYDGSQANTKYSNDCDISKQREKIQALTKQFPHFELWLFFSFEWWVGTLVTTYFCLLKQYLLDSNWNSKIIKLSKVNVLTWSKTILHDIWSSLLHMNWKKGLICNVHCLLQAHSLRIWKQKWINFFLSLLSQCNLGQSQLLLL